MTTKRLPSGVDSGFVPHVGWFSHEPGDELMSLLRQGYFEAAEQAFVWLYLRPGDWVFDCGAHIGLYSVLASRATGDRVHVVSVEASDSTATYLERNLDRNGVRHARVIRSAVWNSSSGVSFSRVDCGRSAYAGITLADSRDSDLVTSVKLDDLIASAGVSEVAFLKIDVEGAELHVLDGGSAAIESGVFPLVMIEFNEHNLQRHGVSSRQLASKLTSLGYQLCEFSAETQRLEPYRVEEPIWYKNLFACRDRSNVNSRLSAVSSHNREIAQDVLDRARACARFKELEELDSYRRLPELVTNLREWAERTEQLLVQEKQINTELRQWAEKAEERVAQERDSTRQMREWAERTDQLLAQERERLASFEKELSLLRAFAHRVKWIYKIYRRPWRKA
jgi:FkbM family methyltransferase